MLQNKNEIDNAITHPHLFPIYIKSFTLFETDHVIIQMERVEPLSRVIDPLLTRLYKRIKHSYPKSDYLTPTIINHALLREEWKPELVTVKDHVEQFFDQSDALIISETEETFKEDQIEAFNKQLQHYYKAVIDEKIICTVECSVENIGLKQNKQGIFEYCILDGGISSETTIMQIVYGYCHEIPIHQLNAAYTEKKALTS